MISASSCRLPAILSTFLVASLSLQALEGPLTPEESLKHFKLEPGLRIEVVAAEPLVIDPVAIAFDEQGRMYVAEDMGYPTGPGKGSPPAGRIALLEDENNDGRYEKRTTFAEGLTFPNGVMPWKGGIYVTCAPDIFYLKDTDGDGKADLKKVVFSGFQAQSTTQLRISHPALNIDNWVYINSGLTASRVTSPECKKDPLQINRLDFRFQPDSCNYEEVSGTGQFGGTFDTFGRRFICSNRNHNQHVVMQGRYLRRNPNFAFSGYVEDTPEHGAACKVYPLSHNITTAASHTGYFTSACGLTIYNGTALPFEYNGNSFTCEPAGNLVHRDILSPSGVTFKAQRAYPTNEFIASPDNWFRPVNLTTGPDGTLYLCDMYRKTIEHPDYLPEATRAITDFTSGKDKGRIYRIVASETKWKPIKLNFAKASTRQLCKELNHANGWHRMTAHRLLLERKPADAPRILKQLAQSAKSPEARVHALHLLAALDALEEAQLLHALNDKYAPVREHAIQLAEPRLVIASNLVDRIIKLANDPDPRVRFQCALTLGEIKSEKIIPALVKIAASDSSDRWSRAAVMSSIGSFPEAFLQQLTPEASKLAQTDKTKLNPMLPLFADLGRSLSSDDSQILSTLRLIVRSQMDADADWQIALLSGYADTLRSKRPSSRSDTSALMTVVLRDSAMTQERISKLMQRAAEISNDTLQTIERRLVSVNLLSHATSDEFVTALQKLIVPSQPSEIQIAAVRALAQMSDPNAAIALVKREQWNGYTQSIKDAVLSIMAGQPKMLDALLSGIERGDISAGSLNPERRNQLMRHKDESISKRASALFKDLKPSDRMAVYEEYKSVLSLKSNPQNGKRIFAQSCIPCHMFSGEGHLVGPDLTGIRSQPAEVVLLHIIVPEFEMMPIYTQYNVETKDGQSFSGVLVNESASSITLKQALSIQQTIPRSQIATINSSHLSLMPQELETTMSKQELADLIGFLKGE